MALQFGCQQAAPPKGWAPLDVEATVVLIVLMRCAKHAAAAQAGGVMSMFAGLRV